MFCFVQLTTPFRERLQILLKSHRFIGSEPYPLPSPMNLSAQAGLLNFWKLGGQSRRVNIAVTLTQALINQPYRWQQTVTRAILRVLRASIREELLLDNSGSFHRHRRYRHFPGTLSLFAGDGVGFWGRHRLLPKGLTFGCKIRCTCNITLLLER